MNATPAPHGRFVWYELAAPDLAAARDFYTKLFGWNVHEEDMGPMGKYPMFGVGETWLGGFRTSDQPGVPAHWMHYVTVPDVDAAVARVPELGGEVLMPATDIPNVGRFAVVKDPAGAVILPFKFAGETPPELPPEVPAGFFCWNELLTTDVDRCEAFYREIFGWNVKTSEMPDSGKYWMFTRGDREEAGMMTMPPQAEAPPHWLPYVAVDDVDATVGKIDELGGSVYCQPTNIPKVGRFAVVADPQGGTFSVFKHEAR